MSSDQQRFQVFVSSTFLDLQEHRQAVTAALLECDAFPSGMELFPAADDDAWTLIKRVIDESDYYLLVIGGKYGSIDPEKNLSYTEMEYDYAVSQKKPVMAFLHGDPESIPVSKSEIESERREHLEAFRDKVKGTKHVKYWTSTEGLAGQVALSFNKFVRQYPATGWIRADRATSAESLQSLAEARAEVERLTRELEASRTTAPPGTEDLSQGDDVFKLPTLGRVTYRQSNGTPGKWGEWVRLDVTWNEVLGIFGPQLLNEAEQEQLRGALQTWIMIYHHEIFIKKVGETLIEKGVDWNKERDFMTIEMKVDDEDFGLIMVQLKALGLITRSDRKRSVSDTGTYWTLTPYGENQTIKVRAIKKNSDNTPPELPAPESGQLSGS